MSEYQAGTEATIPKKWLQCNGQQLRKLFHASTLWLEKHQQIVNELNVFPVPDGDTGTNMLLTMRAAERRVQDNQDRHVGNVAQELAQGALMGARGNSGVILSQVWRGLARALDNLEVATASDIARAFKEASDTAYKGVMRPVEGTILTVVREGAEEAQDAAAKSADLRFILERVLERCQQALERTPDQLPVLKQAGVVDAGGQGFVYVLQGMLRYIDGGMPGELESSAGVSALPPQALAAPEEGELTYPYDVQFLLMGRDLDVSAVRAAISAMGDSTLVVGDERTIKVHVHVDDPGAPLSYGIRHGRVTDIVVENMQMQMEAIIGPNNHARDHGGEGVFAAALQGAADPPSVQAGQIGVVAVAAGPGLGEIFRSLGAAAIVNGGQTNNPSTQEIFEALEGVPTDKIIILPNNKNIILAAEAACDLSDKQVVVVPTRTFPQGVGAILSYDPDGDLEDVKAAMSAAFHHVTSGEITIATRSVTLDGVKVKKGETIGLVDGRLCTSGKEIDKVLLETLRAMAIEHRELLSVYYGQDVSRLEATRVLAHIEEHFPGVEVELLSGGQPHYMFILGAE